MYISLYTKRDRKNCTECKDNFVLCLKCITTNLYKEDKHAMQNTNNLLKKFIEENIIFLLSTQSIKFRYIIKQNKKKLNKCYNFV